MLLGKYVNKYYKQYWYLFLIGFIALIGVDWIQLYIPEYLGLIVNSLTIDYSSKEVMNIILDVSWKIALIALGMMLGRMIWRFVIFGASKRIESNIRIEMFKKATRLSRDYYHQNKIGTIMGWFTSDVQTIEEQFSWGTVMLIDSIFLSLLVLIKMFKTNIFLSILSLIPLLLIVFWGAMVEKVMANKWKIKQESSDKLYDFSSENFTGIHVIKAFNKERKEIRQFSKISNEYKDISIKFARINVIFDIVIEIIISLIVFAIFAFGGYLVYLTINNLDLHFLWITISMKDYPLNPGTLVEFYGYFDSIIWPMIALGQIISMKARAKASLRRITIFLDTPEDVTSPKDAIILKDIKGKITFNNFSFKYPDEDDIKLKNISFEILPGEKVGIVGKVGSGKTTIANILCRLYNFQENAVFVDGVDLMKADIVSLRNMISYVPQDNFLFSDSVENNIRFADVSLNNELVKKAARFANVNSDIENFKDGYQTLSGERGVTLSGGQKQRISIARAFVKNSPIMILDDSVSAVDSSTEETILANIVTERVNKTTIVIASRVSTVAKFDKIIVLNNGEVEAVGSPKTLQDISPTYAKMVFSQKLENEVMG